MPSLYSGAATDSFDRVRKSNGMAGSGCFKDPQSRASSTLFSADIDASYPEGNATSNIWVGDLYLDDFNKSKACHLNLHI